MDAEGAALELSRRMATPVGPLPEMLQAVAAFYAGEARHDPVRRAEVWTALEDLCARGDPEVRAAVGSSFLAWFQSEHERALLDLAAPWWGPSLREVGEAARAAPPPDVPARPHAPGTVRVSSTLECVVTSTGGPFAITCDRAPLATITELGPPVSLTIAVSGRVVLVARFGKGWRLVLIDGQSGAPLAWWDERSLKRTIRLALADGGDYDVRRRSGGWDVGEVLSCEVLLVDDESLVVTRVREVPEEPTDLPVLALFVTVVVALRALDDRGQMVLGDPPGTNPGWTDGFFGGGDGGGDGGGGGCGGGGG